MERDSKGRFTKNMKPWNKGKKIRTNYNFIKNHKIRNSGKTRFKKGCISWNKGTKGIMKSNSGSFKKGQLSWNKGLTKKEDSRISQHWLGKKRTEDTKLKIGNAQRGKPKNIPHKFKKGQIPFNKGKKWSEYMGREGQKKALKNLIPAMKGHNKGNKPWNYIDGRSKTLGPARYGDDWDKIRYLIYLRDRFTCQHCAVKGERLDVHHKIPFLISFDNSLNNLVSLCKPCHRKEEARIMRELKNQKVEV